MTAVVVYGAPAHFEDRFQVRTARQRAAASLQPDDWSAVEDRSTEPVPDIVNALHEKFGIDLGVIAAVGGVSRNALRKWRNGQARPDRDRWRRLIRLHVLSEALTHDGVDPAAWLSRPLDIDPIIRFVDLARVDRFDLLGELRRRAIRPSDAHRAAFPNRGRRAGIDVKATVTADGILLQISDLGLVAEGSSLADAEQELLAALESFLDVATDMELGGLQWLRNHRGEGLRDAVFGR